MVVNLQMGKLFLLEILGKKTRRDNRFAKQRRMAVPIWNDNHAFRQGDSCYLIYFSEPMISRSGAIG